MSTQKALLVTSIGSPLTLTTTHPIPQPSPTQVLLKVKIAALNPHDHKARDYGLFIQGHLPAILTNDVVGTVVSVGSSVSRFKEGDLVFTHATFPTISRSKEGDMVVTHFPGYTQNGLQEYTVADEEFTSKVPEGFTGDDAASLPTNLIAALVGMYDKTGLGIPAPWTEEAKTFNYSDTKILVMGGGSNIGKFAVQLAKLVGIGKIVVVGGKEEVLKKFGATDVVDRHGTQDEVLSRINKVVPGGFEYVFDAINPPEGQLLGLNAISPDKKGKFVRLLPMGPVDDTKILGKKAGYEIFDCFGSSQHRPETCKPFWEKIGEYMAQGKVVPLPYVVEKGLEADKVNEVLDRYRDGKPVTQTHIHIQG